jgi:hypothetical protein
MPTTSSAFIGPTETFRVTDGALPDRNGGIVAGRGVITPTVTSVRRNGKTIPLLPWEFTVLPDASIRYVDPDGVVWSHLPLPATDIPGVTAGTGLQYKAKRWYSQDGVPVRLEEFVFNAPAGGVASLSSLAPVDVVDAVPITKGEPGDLGPTGATPKLVAGTLTAVPSDSELRFELVETSPDVYVINAMVPRGNDGAAGAPGQVGPAGMTWRRFWDPTVDYADSDVVSYGGSSWFAADNPPVGEVPSAESLFWNVMSLHGAPGPAGPAGLDGANAPLPVFSTEAVALPAGAAPTADLEGVYPNLNIKFGMPLPAASDGGSGGDGGGAAVQDTGSWLYYNPTYYSKTMVQRVTDRVYVDFRMRVASQHDAFDIIMINSDGLKAKGFTFGPAWIAQPFSAGRGAVSGEFSWLCMDGYMHLNVWNAKYNLGGYGDVHVQFNYRTFDAFPTDVAAVLPGFSLQSNSNLWLSS